MKKKSKLNKGVMKKLFSVDDATAIMKNIVVNAHKKSLHKTTGSRLKSIFGWQKTSIGMFLDSFYDGFKAIVPENKRNPEIEKIIEIMQNNENLWNNYQKGEEYPATFGYCTTLMAQCLTGIKAKGLETMKKSVSKEISML
jgi:dihydroxyacetone kinase-like predicted kinase